MMRRSMLPLLAVVALATTACPPSYPKCKSDDHCKDHNEVCINGQCQECGKDGDCKAGFSCKEAKCVPAAECANDGQCGAGMKCRAGKCAAECASSGDCGAGMECRAGRCSPEGSCLSDDDCSVGKSCKSNRCVESTCSLETIYFGFNEYSLTSEAQRTLDGVVDCMKKRGVSSTVTIGGHCDERGTEEYNLHLGERRAAAVKRYVSALGIDGSKLRTVSYGEERPASHGHDEDAWAKNRRVEFTE